MTDGVVAVDADLVSSDAIADVLIVVYLVTSAQVLDSGVESLRCAQQKVWVFRVNVGSNEEYSEKSCNGVNKESFKDDCNNGFSKESSTDDCKEDLTKESFENDCNNGFIKNVGYSKESSTDDCIKDLTESSKDDCTSREFGLEIFFSPVHQDDLLIEWQSEHKHSNLTLLQLPWIVQFFPEKCIFVWTSDLPAENGCAALACLVNAIWGKTDYNNLQNLSRAIERHEKSQEHISSSIKFELFGKQNIANVVDTARKRDIENFNEKVRENREILKRLIDAVVYLSKEECSFRGHDETSESDNKGNFKELIDFLKTYDQKLERFLSEATVFVGTSKSIQNDLSESISSVVKHKIQEELRSTAFFSWQIDETTDIACKSQLSVIFRYVIGGDIVERFVGFYDVSSGKNADLKHKLIAQTYDGAAVMSGDFDDLQSKIKNVAPHALFTHCYAHKLNLVLSKACNGIKEVRIFFSNVTVFFIFSKSSKRSEVLNRIVDRRIPTNAPTRWNFSSRAVVTVESQRRKLIEVFEFISESEDFFNDNQTLREAYGLTLRCTTYFLLQENTTVDYQYPLESDVFQTYFQGLLKYLVDLLFIRVFKKIFEHTDVVFQILQNKSTDITYSKTRINSLINQLKEYRSNEIHFNSLYSSFIDDTDTVSSTEEEAADNPQRKKRKTYFNFESKRLHYKQIFAQIFDTIIVQLETRFADLSVLQFFDLVNCDNFSTFSK
nr:unnamed protein product [Callosobruchus analis]